MVSILIPTYERYDVLVRCMDSVIPQITPEMEVIVIDDGSTDGTKEYLLDLAKKHSFVKVHINAENKGVNYTRNRGIELVNKKFILFLDSDDTLYEGSLQKVVDTLKANPEAKHFLFVVSDREEEFTDQKGLREITYQDWITTRVYGDFTHVVRTDLMKKNMFFEQHRAFEYLNWLRVKRATTPQLLVPVVTTWRERGREDSLTTAGKFTSISAIKANFEAEKFYYGYYHEDLKKYYPKALNVKLLRTIILGVASGQKKDSRSLIKYGNKAYVKILGTFVTLLPSPLIKKAVMSYSASKGQ